VLVETIGEYRVVAQNTATTSANKIHDDVVARRYGFAGGLVPGVDVYAYMAHVPADAWGLAWLERGSLRARFLAPVYEGDEVSVVPGEVSSTLAGAVVPLEVRTAAGGVCAVGAAGLPADPPTPPPPGTWGVEPTSGPPPAASPAALRPGTALALAGHGFHADHAGEYLADVGESLPLFEQHGVAHPGWLVRDANFVLSSNVALGPWIHVESSTQHHGVVRDGATVVARAHVTREWENKGHRFVELDVGVFVNADDLVAHVTHTAIYRPRAASD
jgi:acyl dehydratase